MKFSLLQKFIRHGTLTVVAPDGSRHSFGEGTPRVTWILQAPGTYRRVLGNPALALGESYMAGEWDVANGTLHDLLTILRRNVEPVTRRTGRLARLARLLQSWNHMAASRRNVSHHYDLDEALFRACLDTDMHYSAAYFRDRGMSLEAAQRAKCNHIARKLHLRPGMRVLDIGCGWGSLAMHLAEYHDVRVTGITLSQEQLRVARERAAERGLTERVDFLLEDYREHRQRYDRVVSVGMFEHVGKRNYQPFFRRLAELQEEQGVALVHTIASTRAPAPVNPWIRRYVFPGGYIPSLSDVAPAVERSGLIACDLEVLRYHYAHTLDAWNQRFQRHRQQFVDAKGERFCRLWEFYLVSCQTAFELNNLVVHQWQLARSKNTLPITRDYLYPDAPDSRTPGVDSLPQAFQRTE